MPYDPVHLTETQLMLLRAAEEVRKGWCQFALERDGNVCAIGALSRAAFGNAMTLKYSSAYGAAWKRLDARVGNIPAWNNAPDRTAEEVIAVFEAAAFMEVE